MILVGQELIVVWTDLDPTQYFPILTKIGAFGAAYRWVRYLDFKFRFCHLNEHKVDVRGVPDRRVFVG